MKTAGALTALLLLNGCATAPDLRELRSASAPSHALLDAVPFHPQTDYQCGPAALAMALQASGAEASVDALIPQVFLPAREGSVQPEMMAATRRHGRVSYPVGGALTNLLAQVDAGHPVIVLQNLSLPIYPLWHYAVVVGYDLDAGDLILHSGTEARRRMALSTFDKTWARGKRWAMVALPPAELPVGIGALAALAAIHDFERVAGATTALPAWVAATERWPEAAVGWFARGNAHYAAGDRDAAHAAFTAAVLADPGHAPAWINLGTLYEALGQPERAGRAFEAAAAIEGPWQSAATDALARLRTDRIPAPLQ